MWFWPHLKHASVRSMNCLNTALTSWFWTRHRELRTIKACCLKSSESSKLIIVSYWLVPHCKTIWKNYGLYWTSLCPPCLTQLRNSKNYSWPRMMMLIHRKSSSSRSTDYYDHLCWEDWKLMLRNTYHRRKKSICSLVCQSCRSSCIRAYSQVTSMWSMESEIRSNCLMYWCSWRKFAITHTYLTRLNLDRHSLMENTLSRLQWNSKFLTSSFLSCSKKDARSWYSLKWQGFLTYWTIFLGTEVTSTAGSMGKHQLMTEKSELKTFKDLNQRNNCLSYPLVLEGLV